MIFTVDATQPWQTTGLQVPQGAEVTIKYSNGTWIYNSAMGPCTAAGASGLPAKKGYPLPGAPEGALIGRLGDHLFLVGEKEAVEMNPGTNSIELFLVINDDLEHRYGAGLEDNSGSVQVDIQMEMDFTVDATQPWQATGLKVPQGAKVDVAYLEGTWIYNSSMGPCTAEGASGLLAKTGYALPGAPEGALIGRLGDQPFLVGIKGTELNSGTESRELFLVINDDLNQQYGAGLGDNSGAVQVDIQME